jgi:hypothetical protein
VIVFDMPMLNSVSKSNFIFCNFFYGKFFYIFTIIV